MTSPSNIESIFFGAMQRQPGEARNAFLDQACAGNSDLRGQIDRMLIGHDKAGSFLERPALCNDATLSNRAVAEAPGTIIGPYKLLQQIGEGGFGVVYMAEQEKPVKRRVALKVIKADTSTIKLQNEFYDKVDGLNK